MKYLICNLVFLIAIVILLRYIIDSVSSFVNYRMLIIESEDQKNSLSDIPGNEFSCLSSDEFINKYGGVKLHVGRFKNSFMNSLKNTYIDSTYICIDNTVIIPNTYTDYIEIVDYLVKEILIPHDLNKEIKKCDKNYFRNFYNFSYNLYKSEYFNENIEDIVVFDKLPKKYGNQQFIYYDAETKTIFCFGFSMNIMIELVMISYFKIKSSVQTETRYGYERAIYVDINNYISCNASYSETYGISIDNNIIEFVLSTMVDNIEKEENLINVLQDWKSNNYARSIWKSLPTQIEIEYEEMFGESINL